MTEEQAATVHVGSIVTVQGARHRVVSVKLGDIWGPHYRLSSLEPDKYDINDDPAGSLISYRLCGFVPPDDEPTE